MRPPRSPRSVLLATASLLFLCATRQQDEFSQAPGALIAGQSVAMSYSGFREGQHPDRGEGSIDPSRAETIQDLRILVGHGVGLIRLYDAGENSRMVIEVIREEELRIQVVLGCWLRAEVSNHERCSWLNDPIPPGTLAENRLENATEVGRAIALAREYPSVVHAISVGNEAPVEWNDHMGPLERVIAYVRTVKAAVDQPVTVADNCGFWTTEEGARLSRELDFLGVHTYPVWVQKTVDEGMPVTIEDVAKVRAAIPDVPIAVLEAGWASTAAEFGERSSEAIQKRYIGELLAWAERSSTTVFLFEAFDEPWKGDPGNPAGAEKHWGLWSVDRTPKPAVEALRAATLGR